MGLLVESLDELRGATGATVIVVHHTPKDGSGPRGSSALPGAVDTHIEIKRDETGIRVACTKQKDGPEFEPMLLRASPILSSCVLEEIEDYGFGSQDEIEGRAKQALDTLWDSFSETGATASEWLIASGLKRSTYYRVRNDLLKSGDVERTGSDRSAKYFPVKSMADDGC